MGKDPKYLKPIGKGKLYAAKFYVAAYGSLGGLNINEHCQVLDANKEPIPGLYAAGTDANTIYRLRLKLSFLSVGGVDGIPSVAVKCVDIGRNTGGEGGLLDDN